MSYKVPDTRKNGVAYPGDGTPKDDRAARKSFLSDVAGIFLVPDLCNKFEVFQEISILSPEGCLFPHSSSVYRSFIPASLNISSEDPA